MDSTIQETRTAWKNQHSHHCPTRPINPLDLSAHWQAMIQHSSLNKSGGSYPAEFFYRAFEWLVVARAIIPSACDWIGLYFMESFLYSDRASSTDLLLGPFLGEPTEHQRIALSKGFCGMALREQRVVNVSDVRAQADIHIACSLHTRSELVIPLRGPKATLVGELDIDSNRINAFSPEIEDKITQFSASFHCLF